MIAQRGEPSGSSALPSGSPAQAGWRIRNTGGCTWDTSYMLISEYLTQPMFLERTVRPGEMIDLKVNFYAPFQPGEFRMTWQLVDGASRAVGDPLAILVRALDLPVPTVGPGIWLRAYPDTIQPGDITTISWDVSEAREVYFYPYGQDWKTHPVTSKGDFADTPIKSQSYELRVVRGDDSVEIYRVRVTVEPFDPPRIILFKASRPEEITGLCADVEWEVRGRVNLVTLLRDGKPILVGLPDLGVLRDCPGTSGTMVYVLKINGPGGEVCAERRVVIP